MSKKHDRNNFLDFGCEPVAGEILGSLQWGINELLSVLRCRQIPARLIEFKEIKIAILSDLREVEYFFM